jgi:hypothetical protein
MIEAMFLFIIFGSGVAAGFIGGSVFKQWREEPHDIPEWSESYFRDERPRVVTRIKSKDIDWELQ